MFGVSVEYVNILTPVISEQNPPLGFGSNNRTCIGRLADAGVGIFKENKFKQAAKSSTCD